MKKKKTAIAVFCKTPGISPLKTRLGADMGKDFAEEFYQLSVMAIAEVLKEVQEKSNNEVCVYWAVAEKEGLNHPMYNSFPRIWTEEGDLGERIYHVFEELFTQHEQVIIMGSDSPQITPEYVLQAVDVMNQGDNHGVIGPCVDGGFVLFGSKTVIEKSIWTKVNYSQEDTLEQLVKYLDSTKFKYEIISSIGDVDEKEDLFSLLNDFMYLGSKILPRQLYLCQWIQKVLITEKFMEEVKKQVSRK